MFHYIIVGYLFFLALGPQLSFFHMQFFFQSFFYYHYINYFLLQQDNVVLWEKQFIDVVKIAGLPHLLKFLKFRKWVKIFWNLPKFNLFF